MIKRKIIITYSLLFQLGATQRHIRTRAGHRCEHCKMPFQIGTNKAVFHKNRDGKPTIGTVHHIDRNPANNEYENLVYLCQRCHLHIQMTWRPGNTIPDEWLDEMNMPPKWILKRGLNYLIQMKF